MILWRTLKNSSAASANSEPFILLKGPIGIQRQLWLSMGLNLRSLDRLLSSVNNHTFCCGNFRVSAIIHQHLNICQYLNASFLLFDVILCKICDYRGNNHSRTYRKFSPNKGLQRQGNCKLLGTCRRRHRVYVDAFR